MEYYEIKCPVCGKIVDKRDPGSVLSHAMKNPETGLYECFDGEGMIQYSSSIQVGEPVQWVKGKLRLDLN